MAPRKKQAKPASGGKGRAKRPTVTKKQKITPKRATLSKKTGRPVWFPGRPSKSPGCSAKSPGCSAKSPGRPSKSPGRPAKSPSRPSKSPGRPAKSSGRPAKSPGHPAKSPGRPVKSRGRPAKSRGRPAKSRGRPAKSPGRPAKSPGRPAKSPGRPAKSPGRPAKSPGRPAKSPVRSIRSVGHLAKSSDHLANSPGHLVKATGCPANSPVRSAKSSGRSTKSPGHPAKSPGHRAKSPGRPARSPRRPAKSPTKSPGRPAKSGGHSIKSPGRLLKSPGQPGKSPSRPVKYKGRNVKWSGRSPTKAAPKSPTRGTRSHQKAGPVLSTRSSSKAKPRERPKRTSPATGVAKGRRGRPAKKHIKATQSPEKKSPKKAPVTRPATPRSARSRRGVVSTKVSPKSSPKGKPVQQTLAKAMSPAKRSPRKSEAATPEKKSAATRQTRSSPQKVNISPQKGKTQESSPQKPQSGSMSPRKRAFVASNPPDPPSKKGKQDTSSKGVKDDTAAKPKEVVTPSRRPSRIIQPPARLRDAAPEKPARRTQKKTPAKATPAKPAETRPSRADMVSRSDEAKKKKGTPLTKTKPESSRISPRSPAKKAELPVKRAESPRSPATKVGSPKSPAKKVELSRSPAKKAESPRSPVNKAEPPVKNAQSSRSPAKKAESPVKTAKSPMRNAESTNSPVKKAESPKSPAKKAEPPESPAKKTQTHKPLAKKAESPKSPVKKAESPKAHGKEAKSPKSPVKKAESPKAHGKEAESPKSPVKESESSKITQPGEQATPKGAEKPILKVPQRPGTASGNRSPSNQSPRATPKRVTIVEPQQEAINVENAPLAMNVEETPSSPTSSQPCKHCGLMFKLRPDVELHESQCSKNESRTDKRYQCNKCSGMFTMSDLILHKKQAHPQRDVPTAPSAEEDAEWERARAIGTVDEVTEPAITPIRTDSGGLVFKVRSDGNLSEVIRQAVQAAAHAGLVPPNKKIVVSGQKGAEVSGEPSSTPPAPEKRKQAENLPAVVAKRPKAASPVSKPAAPAPKPQVQGGQTATPTRKIAMPTNKVFTCLDCGDTFPSRKHVSDHKAECPGVGQTSVHACMDCNQTFTSRLLLNAHKREAHVATRSTANGPGVTIRSYKCSECELFFPVESEVKNHIAEIHGGVGNGTMCNVVATPEDIRSGSVNKPVSSDMVEGVIQDIVNGVSQRDGGPGSPTQNTSQPAPPAAAQSTSPARSPVRPASPAKSPERPKLVEPGPNRTPGQCLDCFMKVSSRLELAQHKRHCQKAIENRQLFCFDCSSSFKTYFELSRHKHEMHSAEPHSLKCLPCCRVFKTHAEWIEHCKTHMKEAVARNKAADKARKDKIVSANSKLFSAKSKAQKASPQDAQEENASVPKKDAIKRKAKQTESEIQRTRSGRVVQKKKNDDVIMEKVIKGTRVKAGKVNISPTAKAIGTVRFLNADPDSQADAAPASPDKRSDSKKSPRKREHQASKSSDESATPAKRSTKSKDATESSKEEEGDETSNISLANGLVTISADKANDYQIFVDASKDGSSIQVKLIRNEENRKDEDSTEGVKAMCPESPSAEEDKGEDSPGKAADPKPVLKQAAKQPEKQAQANAQGSTKKTQTSATTQTKSKEAPAKPAAEKASTTDMGKVVQKGKPFVIGGQTLVPIQFPPDFELPGGATGGQKVFAIPSTNLPPGLLQLLAKQNKAMSTPQERTTQKASVTQSTATEGKPGKKKPAILRQSTSKTATVAKEVSLKGMTGAQLMARAQARILGRPLPPLKIDGPIPPFKKAAQATTSKDEVSGKSPSTKVKSTAKEANQQHKSGLAGAKSGSKAGAKAHSTEAQPARPQFHPDPLYVYQCTSCKQNFKSTGDINKHMKTCGTEAKEPERQTRLSGKSKPKQASTDVWHIKPVASTSGSAKDKVANVEWYVASKNT